MRRIHLVLSVLGLLTASAIGTVVGCGSDDPAPIAAPPDGAASSSSTTSSGAASSSSGGDPGDGGSTTSSSSSSSGSTASNPFKISCGTSECDAGGGNGTNGGGLCCLRDGGTNPVCLPLNQANLCENNATTLEARCDETADCPKTDQGPGQNNPQVCCLTRGGSPQTSCGLTCGGGAGEPARAQLCKTSAECGDGGACSEKTCRGFKLRVCGSPTDCQ